MPSARTENRKKKRALLREIIEDFLTVYAQSDNMIENLGMVKLQSLKLDSANMVKQVRAVHRECIDSYICPNGDDTTVEASPTCVFFNVKKSNNYNEKAIN